MLRFFAIVFSFCLSISAHAATTYYCMNIEGTRWDDLGATPDESGLIYASLDDSTYNLVIEAGLLKGKIFTADLTTGPTEYDMSISGDNLFGTTPSPSTIVLDVTNKSSGKIKLTYSPASGGGFTFNGVEGACTLSFAGKYCAKSVTSNKLYEIGLSSATAGAISGSIKEYPTGSTVALTGSVDTSGLGVTISNATSGESLILKMAKYALTGNYYPTSVTDYSLMGVRDPMGLGCDNIKVHGEAAEFYYTTPTITGGFIYAGTAGGANHSVSANNFLVKLNSMTFESAWRLPLGSKEVRGPVVRDSLGAIYFVVEEDRALNVSGDEPDNDNSNSVLYLYSYNDNVSPPTFRWKFKLAPKGNVKEAGFLSPAIDSSNKIYVGGDKLFILNRAGVLQDYLRYSNGATICPVDSSTVYSSPLVHTVTSGVNAGDTLAIFHSSCGIHAYNVTKKTLAWDYNPFTTFVPSQVQISSPQFGKTATEVRVYSALNGQSESDSDTIHCFKADDGSACTGWTAAGCNMGNQGSFRASPIVDASGNVFIGSKNNASSQVFSITSSCTTRWTAPNYSDNYPTGVLTSDGYFVQGNENKTAANGFGTVNYYNASSGSLASSGIFNFHGEPTWGSFRIHTNTTSGQSYLAGVLDDGGALFNPGILYSMKTSYGYDTTALNPTFRGSNANQGN